jgi:carboxymethylenebutenolidase
VSSSATYSSAYFVGPDPPGKGLLLLHSWWGLTRYTKQLADRLSDEGFTVLAPDLFEGKLPADLQLAEATLREADPNYLASSTLSSVNVLARRFSDIGVIGMGMGGSLGLWASVRAAEFVTRVVSFYGTQTVDFTGSSSGYLVHLADRDPWVSSDDAAFMQATMGLEGLQVEMHSYPGTEHGFFEPGDTYDQAAADLAWKRTLAFLR